MKKIAFLILLCAACDAQATKQDAGDPGVLGDPGEPVSDQCDIANVVAAISQDRIEQTVAELTNLPARTSHAEQQAAAELLQRTLSDSGIGVRLHQYTWQGQNWVNLEVTILGGELPEEIYIVGAHFDSASSVPDDAPGADDNASGTAAVVEIARVLSGCQFRRTIRLVLFSNEEVGTIGSGAYVQDALLAGDNISGYLNLDMIAFGPADEDLDVATQPAFEDLAQTVVEAAELWTELDTVTHIDDHCS